uniref:Uncharacterized protein n=1 Tax=mine drainage metagenome TaxID=410659 RepID=E6QN59_9ZZZZ
MTALRDEESPRDGLGTEIAAFFHGMGLTEDIPEIRGTLATRNARHFDDIAGMVVNPWE